MVELIDDETILSLYQDIVHENLLQVYVKTVYRDSQSYLRTRRFSEKTLNIIREVICLDWLILKYHQEFMKS